MRILLGYNGSEASTAAIYDLHNAGLGSDTEALVFTTAEEWSHPQTPDDARRVCDEGVALVRSEFPEWQVAGETAAGSPPREILARSESYNPDLIVVGEPRHDLNEHNLFVGH